jgi:hypothetical protein
MDDRSKEASQVGMVLKEIALKSGPAFPDFDAVFNSRKHVAWKNAAKAFVVIAVLSVGIGFGLLIDERQDLFAKSFREGSLIEGWGDSYGEVPATLVGTSGIHKEIGYFLSDLWNSSSAAIE